MCVCVCVCVCVRARAHECVRACGGGGGGELEGTSYTKKDGTQPQKDAKTQRDRQADRQVQTNFILKTTVAVYE